MIEWKEISALLMRYDIFKNGNVYDSLRGRMIKRHTTRNGYEYVHLRYQGKSKLYSVHRLVGIVYVPGYEPNLDINHIDGNKTNNHFNNLEWVTRSRNIKHAYENNLRGSCKGIPKTALGKAIVQIGSDGGIITSFESISAARRATGAKNISKVLSGERSLSGGFVWKYKEAM